MHIAPTPLYQLHVIFYWVSRRCALMTKSTCFFKMNLSMRSFGDQRDKHYSSAI